MLFSDCKKVEIWIRVIMLSLHQIHLHIIQIRLTYIPMKGRVERKVLKYE
jgi:hypothetical protein